jgi:hypothetical protein
MTWLAPLVGVFALLMLVGDVYATVFVPRGSAGPLSRRLYAASWKGWSQFGDRLPPDRRRRWLALIGPLLVPLTVMVWGALLVVGYALLYYPWAGTFFVSPAETEGLPAWLKALYYSGYSATTLGIGDVVPHSGALRLVAVVEAAHGFMLFSVGVTYLLSIYTALNRTTALALEISRFMGRGDGGDPVGLLITMVHAGAERDIRDWLARTASSLARVVQAEAQYPLLHYFHVPDDDHALPVALTDLLEVVTLGRALLSPADFPALAEGPPSAAIERLVWHHLRQGADQLGSRALDAQALEQERRKSYLDARARLEAASVPVREDGEAWAAYAALRAEWDASAQRVRAHFGYSEPCQRC